MCEKVRIRVGAMARERLIAILDGEDPAWGRGPAFVVQGLIVLSATVLTIETLPTLNPGTRTILLWAEAILLGIFVVEYLARLFSAPRPLEYALSFWGIVDFLACIPAALFLFPDLQAIRAFRLLRLVRLLKLLRASHALDRMSRALTSIREELIVFSFVAVAVLFLTGVGIYHFERTAQPEAFGSIPHSLWWAVASLSTVGYGDVYPITTGGRIFTGFVLLIGLGVVAVPAGLITAALMESHAIDDRSDDEPNEF